MIRRLLMLVMVLSLIPLLGAGTSPGDLPPGVIELRKIWDAGEHNAFTDIVRWKDAWWCTFREASDHAGGADGKIRVITSPDGGKWESAALIAEQGIDLRDPKFSVMPNGRLMIVAGGSVYVDRSLKGRQPRVLFSADGRKWTQPKPVLHQGAWLWRVSWHGKTAYGAAYTQPGLANSKGTPGESLKPGDMGLKLYRSVNGVDWDLVTPLEVPGRPNETTVRVLQDGRMMAMVRRGQGSLLGWVGTAPAPFTKWTWRESSHQFGGPNFIELPDGTVVAGTRDYTTTPERTTLVGTLHDGQLQPVAHFPSGGDNSYPGFALHEGVLWVSYYSSHEGKASIYLAKMVPPAASKQLRLISIDNVCAWPNLTVLRDGTITASIFGQPSHGLKEGSAEVWASTDGGRFWEKRGIPAPHEPNTIRMNLAAGMAGNGDLLVLCSGWTNEKQPERPKQTPFRDAVLRSWVCRSSDGGRTWTQIKEFPAAEPGFMEMIPFGDIFAGEDGALHVSCYAGEFADPTKSTKTKGWRAWHFRSDDDGRTWKRTSVIGPKHNETTILPLGGKKWLAAARIDAVEIFRSDDDGQTWTGPVRATERNEINGHLQKLKDGRILLTYGVRVAGRYGVAAKLSSDEGATWGPMITLVDDLTSGDCGYPSSIQRPDGSITTAYYAKGAPNHHRYHMGTLLWNVPPRSGN